MNLGRDQGPSPPPSPGPPFGPGPLTFVSAVRWEIRHCIYSRTSLTCWFCFRQRRMNIYHYRLCFCKQKKRLFQKSPLGQELHLTGPPDKYPMWPQILKYPPPKNLPIPYLTLRAECTRTFFKNHFKCAQSAPDILQTIQSARIDRSWVRVKFSQTGILLLDFLLNIRRRISNGGSGGLRARPPE